METSPTTVSPTPTRMIPAPSSTSCDLDPVVIPTLPAIIPGYTQLDTITNLHVTVTYQIIDLDTYRLEVTGRVDHPLRMTYDELRCLPRLEQRLILVCPGFFEDEATWAGASLVDLLELAGVHTGATQAELISADGYSVHMGLERVRKAHNFLAYEWEGQPLPILHGFPLRAVFPDDPSARWVKWLVKIDIK